jgi:hypothetical protein
MVREGAEWYEESDIRRTWSVPVEALIKAPASSLSRPTLNRRQRNMAR